MANDLLPRSIIWLSPNMFIDLCKSKNLIKILNEIEKDIVFFPCKSNFRIA